MTPADHRQAVSQVLGRPPAAGTADTPTREVLSATPGGPRRLAIVGAGPVGLALALQAAAALPRWHITLHDTRPLDRDVGADPRTLALSLGSVQALQRLGAWPADAAQPIEAVHVSQAPPSWGADAAVRLSAADQGVSLLGAVVAYGPLVSTLQNIWLRAVEQAPHRLTNRFGAPVAALKAVARGVEVDAGTVETHDLAVIAEGGVFATQSRKALSHDYGQRAWVGTVVREGTGPGTAFERFTRQGPLALLPLARSCAAARLFTTGQGAHETLGGPTDRQEEPGSAAGPDGLGRHPMALVWCTASDDDAVPSLDDRQRLAVLNTLLPAAAGRLVEIGPLKGFDLGLNAERTLVQGRQVRIGNAAQTLHPVAGQGLNLGLRDALSLVQALRRQEDIDAALRQTEWQRAPDRWALIATTDFLARSFTWHAPGVAAARGLALAALQALPPLKRALARHMMFGRR